MAVAVGRKTPSAGVQIFTGFFCSPGINIFIGDRTWLGN